MEVSLDPCSPKSQTSQADPIFFFVPPSLGVKGLYDYVRHLGKRMTRAKLELNLKRMTNRDHRDLLSKLILSILGVNISLSKRRCSNSIQLL